ncbi:hypothetical protein MJO28_016973 [Puccinia striiformis f. sp. tritici]|nr:hypothetical protein MJO28_016973 [Puccinia striiformis f. sp. tritici]
MVEFYLSSQKQFTSDIQSHYIYSPRKLTRWVRGIHQSIKPLETLSLKGLVRIWAHKALMSVDRAELHNKIEAKFHEFDKHPNVCLVLFDDFLDHFLRINCVFSQVQGHLLLIGVSGNGKTTLSQFVAWMNSLSVFVIKVHNEYTAGDFDNDLRNILHRSGGKGEKICFIVDESNVLHPGCLKWMNTLLTNNQR